MAALDDVDGVDLQIAQMLYGAKGRVAPVAKRRPLIEALGVKPDAPRLHFIERDGVARRLGHGVSLSRQRHETTTSFLGTGRPARPSDRKRPCMGAGNRRPSVTCYITVSSRRKAWKRFGANKKARWIRADALIQRAGFGCGGRI
jgi:hypothetical protein